MRKCELKNNMIVETSGGTFGVVVFKDSTDNNCIKFLYDPEYLLNHGCVYNRVINTVVSLDEFDENMNWCYNENGDTIIVWQIIRAYNLDLKYEISNLRPECNGLIGDSI